MAREMEDVVDLTEENDVNEDGEVRKKNKSIRKPSDLIKFKLDKLMENFEKPVVIPEIQKPRPPPVVPDFVRNVMGSSAGAGSGEFHVYRHLRRKEFARQKFIQNKSRIEELDEAYHKKIEENAKIAAERTAKKRARRLKRKEKLKGKKPKGEVKEEKKESSESDDGEEEEKQKEGTCN